jgi:hypothetical protein
MVAEHRQDVEPEVVGVDLPGLRSEMDDGPLPLRRPLTEGGPAGGGVDPCTGVDGGLLVADVTLGFLLGAERP